MKKGFTLVELLVVVSVLSVLGVIILTIFTRTLKGNNKAQIISSIKQNGQAVLENMDKIIRGSDKVLCVSTSKFTIVLYKDGEYTRYRFVPPKLPNTANGQIQADNPIQPSDVSQDKSKLAFFQNAICSDTDPMGDANSSSPLQVLTDTNLQTGVSVENGKFDNKNSVPGFKDTVTISFQLKPALLAPAAITGQIDPVNFETTVQLR